MALKIQRNISFGISLESKLFYLDLMKTLINILFFANIGKNLGLFKKNNKNLNPLKIQSNINFGISLESK